MKIVAFCAGLVVLLAMTGACSAPVPGRAVTASSPGPLGGLDPCWLISADQARQLGLWGPHRTDAKSSYAECSWSTTAGDAVAVRLDQEVHTVQEYLAKENAAAPNSHQQPPTASPWVGKFHQGLTLSWGDGHSSCVVIAVNPTQIATVAEYHNKQEIGSSIAEVLRAAVAEVDQSLPE
ncbi:hypothetical protein F0L68_27560 [Solihabitans fulvus]|uniref:DUF3558 domain-containing protein n=1 Tax=Solihabitans fulvus TaxID=1892852 RepID=A0A5B2WZQ4_9PSEU|nr:hypothetical protein [Solihabitans fulvus]KAA2255949.1 hypothetical protein F0L68_27560 [Solihabitans fulvus]